MYDGLGALRDVVQNHLLQLTALIAMEPPVGASADELRDKKFVRGSPGWRYPWLPFDRVPALR